MKRLIDIAGAAVGLVLLSPFLAAGILAVRRTSTGPGIFVQRRVGRNGMPFRCYKLRTMYADTPSVPTHEATAAQVTPIGRFLRRWKLDELPQLWNVLKGEMSLVGPRPCLPEQVELVEERRRLGVMALRPGITGLAQARGIDMSDPVRLAAVDAEYLENRSFGLDLAILLRTVFGGEANGDRIG
jgi:O-antigen biosynthesis protein WbqP